MNDASEPLASEMRRLGRSLDRLPAVSSLSDAQIVKRQLQSTNLVTRLLMG
jgi:hypothetical protein